jgi:DNA-3-methyladenine glycosylase I
LVRCPWAQGPEYEAYHDTEWGVPSRDDRHLFEMLVLEGAQAGLSWLTILRRREGYRAAFAGFDPQAVARFDAGQKAALLADARIIRNRAKIDAAVHNAGRFLDIQAAFGSFDAYIWRFVDGRPVQGAWSADNPPPATTPAAQALAKDLKSRGFKFLGPTTVYAHMQAAGLVNDHTTDCFRHDQCAALAAGSAAG